MRRRLVTTSESCFTHCWIALHRVDCALGSDLIYSFDRLISGGDDSVVSGMVLSYR